MTSLAVSRASAGQAIARLRQSRDAGVLWLLSHVADDVQPVGAERQNGRGRVPWALAVSGESAAGAAVLSWAERHALAEDGRFHPGVFGGASRFGAYGLAHFAIGAWLLKRFELAQRCMGALRAI